MLLNHMELMMCQEESIVLVIALGFVPLNFKQSVHKHQQQALDAL